MVPTGPQLSQRGCAGGHTAPITEGTHGWPFPSGSWEQGLTIPRPLLSGASAARLTSSHCLWTGAGCHAMDSTLEKAAEGSRERTWW